MAKPFKPTASAADDRASRLAALRAKLQNVDLGGNGGSWWSPSEGKSTIRILPGVGGMAFFYQQVGKHVLDDKGKKSEYCPKFTSEGELECPICELVDQLYKQGDKASKEMAGNLRFRRMFWMNVIVRGKRGRNGEVLEEDKGPFVYTPGPTVFSAIVAMITDPEYGDIFDPENGLDIVIERTGTGLDTEYQVLGKRNASPLSEDPDQAQEWLNKAKDLSYVLVTENAEEDKELTQGHTIWVKPYDRLFDELDLGSGGNFMGDYESEDEEPPARKAAPAKANTAKANSRKVVEEPEEDEDVDEDEDEDLDDEEEEDEPPAKAKAKTPPVKASAARTEVQSRLAARKSTRR